MRVPVLAVLLASIVLGNLAWWQKVFVAVMLTLLAGTFRRSCVRGDKFRTGMTIMFYRLPIRQWKLERFVTIEVETEGRLHFGWVVLMELCLWLWLRLSDYLFPWIGGEFGLWLCSVKGKRVLAWQGNSEDYFRNNLEMLETATGAEVQRKGR